LSAVAMDSVTSARRSEQLFAELVMIYGGKLE
jgi:hypothetical protein